MSRLAAWNRDRQFTQGVPLRFGERTDATCDAFESLPIRSMESVQRPLERRLFDHDRLVRLQVTEALRLPLYRGLALSTHGVDNFGSDCERFSRQCGATPPDDLRERARR